MSTEHGMSVVEAGTAGVSLAQATKLHPMHGQPCANDNCTRLLLTDRIHAGRFCDANACGPRGMAGAITKVRKAEKAAAKAAQAVRKAAKVTSATHPHQAWVLSVRSEVDHKQAAVDKHKKMLAPLKVLDVKRVLGNGMCWAEAICDVTEDDPDHDSTGAIMFRVLGTFLWADGTQHEQERWVPALDAGRAWRRNVEGGQKMPSKDAARQVAERLWAGPAFAWGADVELDEDDRAGPSPREAEEA